MGLACSAKLAKYILFIFNVIFWLCGLTLLILGLVFVFSPNLKIFHEMANDLDNSLRASSFGIIIIGSIMTIIGFAGCCGAIKESICLLVVYMAFLLALLISHVVIAVFIGFKMPTVKDSVGDEFKKQMKEYPPGTSKNSTNPTKDLIDRVQYELLQCCGGDGPDDWKTTNWYTKQTGTKKAIPPSCCRDVGYPNYDDGKYSQCLQSSSKEDRFTDGCRIKFKEWVETNYPILVAVCSIIAIVEVIGVFLAICLCMSIRREGTDRRRQV